MIAHPAGMVQITKHLWQYLNQSAKDKNSFSPLTAVNVCTSTGF
jgi:hypothetical protein